jgi:hypothetical protein
VIARSRAFLTSLRVTPATALLLALLCMAFAAALLGPRRAQGAAFAVAIAAALMIAVGAFSAARRRRRGS